MRVVVLGAGALGAASAYHLGRAGHDVTVVEAIQVAGATTGLAAGILSLGLLDANDRALTTRTMAGLERLYAEHPPEGADTGPLLHRPGSHLLAAPGPEADVVERIRRGIAATDPGDVARLAPHEWKDEMARRGVEADVDGIDTVLSLPRDAWALSTEATTCMMRAARATGVRFRTGRAERLLEREGSVRGVTLADGARVEADAVVLALGAWSRGFLDAHGLALPARGYRTHAAVLRTPLARDMPIVHDNAGCFYLRPEGPEHLLVGDGTRTDPVTPEEVTQEPEQGFLDAIAERVPSRFPGLADARLQNAWRGVLTGVPDKRPLVGAHPDRPGLFLCTGGNGYGFMRSYALGACLRAAIDDDTPEGLSRDILGWMDPARLWPDPPRDFPVMEGFQLLPPSHPGT